MILKALTLENIRSYKDETQVQFPVGTILFEGDIASGKSTILYAIEFALFGLGSMRSSSLLRNGAREGRVTLVFEADGKEYEVHRRLVKKGKLVHQDECYVSGPEGRAVLSATELKERILQILGFNEPPNPKAQSVIYRYAIFTPQEEMKEVILKDPDERLQTLRKAFRIEDYKVAADNSSMVIAKVKERRKYLEGATLDLDTLKTKVEKERKLIKDLTAELEPLKLKETELRNEVKRKMETLKQLQTEREKIKQTEVTIPILNKQMEENSGLLQQAVRQNQELAKRVGENIQPKITEFEPVKKPTEKTKEQLKQEQSNLRTKLNDVEKLRGRFDERIGNFSSILEKKVCPVCERSVDPEEFRGKSKHLEEERSKLEKEIGIHEKGIAEIDGLIEQLAKYEDAQNQLSILRPQLKEAQESVQQNNLTISRLSESIEGLKANLKAAQAEIEPLQDVLLNIEKLEKEIEATNLNVEEIGKQVTAKETTIETSKKNTKELQDQVDQKEKWLKTIKSLDEHKVWLGEYLAPTIENIEKHVMTSLNQRFNEQFQRWFQILIDDPDMQVRVNEDFSPLVEHDGYEQEFIALSGGEKTSVALAYRLALNTTVQEVAIAGGSNLLILDEPTDGFSKEQILKIRDILAELRCPQVVLVSHEKELEGFADHVFRVQKSDGTSRVTSRATAQ